MIKIIFIFADSFTDAVFPCNITIGKRFRTDHFYSISTVSTITAAITAIIAVIFTITISTVSSYSSSTKGSIWVSIIWTIKMICIPSTNTNITIATNCKIVTTRRAIYYP